MPEELVLQTGKDSDLLYTAKKRFKLAVDAESKNREESLDDLKFSIGKQWPGDIMAGRSGRVSLVMDQLQQSIGQVCNEYRQQRPATQINPVGDDADVETAEILQGIVRHIEVNCDAEIAYDRAHEQVVRTGFGHWRFLTEYIDDDGAQEIYIKHIRNQFTVYWQPGVEHEDATWAFIVSDIPNPDYKEDYKDSELAKSLNQFTSTGDTQAGWITNEYIRVAEYFTVEETRPKGKAVKRKVTWRKINAIEELDKKELPGSTIPIFTPVGHDIDVNGKRYLAGLVRNAKDPQRMYNYWNSAATEAIALAPKAPFIMAEGQDEGHEGEWKTANVTNWSTLYYKPISLNGTTLPPPQRQVAEVPVQALLQMTQQAGINIKAATGLYDPSLGIRKSDESGKAIEKLQKQGDIATLNFSDNTAREMRRSGRCLIDWIRYYYEVPQVQRIVNPDGTVTQVVIHNGAEQKAKAEKIASEAEIKKIFDIGTGRYDVTVSVGPSYQTKRQEAVATQIELLKIMQPQQQAVVLDLVVRNTDIPQAKEIADRLKKTLPPNLQDDGDSPEAQLQKAQSTLQQMSQQHELMTKALNDAAEVIKSKKIEQDGKAQIAQMQEQTRLQIVKMQEATKLAVAQINASKDLHESFAENEINQYDLLHGAAHELAMQKDQQAHEQQLAAQQAQNEQQSQQSDQAHEAGMTAVQQDHEQNMAAQEEPANAGQ